MRVEYKIGITGLSALRKLENLEELVLYSFGQSISGDKEMKSLQRDFYQTMPKLKIFNTNGFDNDGMIYELGGVDCSKISAPCALVECYTYLEDAKVA